MIFFKNVINNFFALFFICFSSIAQEAHLNKEHIKEQLASMVKTDQEMRSNINVLCPEEPFSQKKQMIDAHNTAALQHILQEYYWITISEFGADADQQAWLLVQHADHDLSFQKEILERLEKLYISGETNAAHYAYLYDRVAVAEKRPQRYGTQGSIKGGKWIANTIEEIEHLNVRRKSMGLMTFEEYLNNIHRMFNIPRPAC